MNKKFSVLDRVREVGYRGMSMGVVVSEVFKSRQFDIPMMACQVSFNGSLDITDPAHYEEFNAVVVQVLVGGGPSGALRVFCINEIEKFEPGVSEEENEQDFFNYGSGILDQVSSDIALSNAILKFCGIDKNGDRFNKE